MDAIDNRQTIQSIIDIQYGILESEQTLYAALSAGLLALVSGNIPDYSSISNAGEAGSESWSQATFNERLNSSAQRMEAIRKELRGLMELQTTRFPEIRTDSHVEHRGYW